MLMDDMLNIEPTAREVEALRRVLDPSKSGITLEVLQANFSKKKHKDTDLLDSFKDKRSREDKQKALRLKRQGTISGK